MPPETPQDKQRGDTPDLSPEEEAILDEVWKGLQKPAAASPDLLPGGKAAGRSDAGFDPEQLAAGQKVESEHTTDPAIAREIARDHLAEDPDYYKKLKKMEASGPAAPAKAPPAAGT